MDIQDFLHKKLAEYKSRIISWLKEIDDDEVRKWEQSWSSGSLFPPPFKKGVGVSSFTFDGDSFKSKKNSSIDLNISLAVSFFEKAVSNFESMNYEVCLEKLFFVVQLLGHKQGVKVERARVAKEIANRRHKDTYDNKNEALRYYREKNLNNLSNEKAASELGKVVHISHRTLVSWVAEERKRSKVAEQFGQEMYKVIEENPIFQTEIEKLKATPEELAELKSKMHELARKIVAP